MVYKEMPYRDGWYVQCGQTIPLALLRYLRIHNLIPGAVVAILRYLRIHNLIPGAVVAILRHLRQSHTSNTQGAVVAILP